MKTAIRLLLLPVFVAAQSYVFGPNVRVNDGPPGNNRTWTASPGQHLVAARGDTVFAVWEDSRDSAAHVFFARSFDQGQHFLSSTQVDRSMSGTGPSLALDELGGVHVTWVNEDSSQGRFTCYARSTDGGQTFSTPVRACDTAGAGLCGSNSIAVSRNGQFVAVVREDNYRVWLSRSFDGGQTFAAPDLRLDSNPEGSMTPVIAVFRDSVVLITWTSAYYDEVFLTKSGDRGRTFGPRQRLSSPDWAMASSVCVDDSGRVCVIMVGDSIRLTVSPNVGDSFPRRWAVPGTEHVQQASLSVSRSGRLYLAWNFLNPAAPDSCEVRFTCSTDGGNIFSPPVDPSDGLLDDDEKCPAVTASEPGQVFCLWTDTRDYPGQSAGNIYLATGTGTSISELTATSPRAIGLELTPNPVSSVPVVLRYSLPAADNVSLKLYDATGKLVNTLVGGYHPAGSYSYSLLTSRYSLAPGVYYCRLRSRGFTASQKLVKLN